MTFDCQACGACCCNPDENRAERYRDYVEVPARSPIPRSLTVVNDKRQRHMRLVGPEQRCAALRGTLGKRVTCTVYELRPSGCRKVEAGSKMCLQYRAERGIHSA